MTIVLTIISGGQTGADMGGLEAARTLGVETGGTAPQGWLTEDGPQELLLRGFGLVECSEPGYDARTRRNVVDSDATLLIGDYRRGGSALTYEIAMELRKPVFHVPYPTTSGETTLEVRIEEFRRWLLTHRIRVLNVAGNRESTAPGIREFTRSFLERALAFDLRSL